MNGNMTGNMNGNMNSNNTMMSNGNVPPYYPNANALSHGYSSNRNVMNTVTANMGNMSVDPMHNASAPSMSSIQRGNQSVLNVLTGEPSPPQSYPVTSAETTPQKTATTSPKQDTPGKA